MKHSHVQLLIRHMTTNIYDTLDAHLSSIRGNLWILCQYHGSWCPGSLRRQAIINHGIDCLQWLGPCLPRGRISTTCIILILRNGGKYKYMFVFSEMLKIARVNASTVCHWSCLQRRILEIIGFELFSARLQYLQCVSYGDTAVLHQSIDMITPLYISYNYDVYGLIYHTVFLKR